MAKNNTPVDKNSREYLLRQVANGRYSLLLIVILTVVNLIMTILDTNTYFLFSASVPYYLVFMGMGIENGFVDGAWNVKGTLTYTGLVIALVIVAVYLLCWLLSKKRAGWLTAAWCCSSSIPWRWWSLPLLCMIARRANWWIYCCTSGPS